MRDQLKRLEELQRHDAKIQELESSLRAIPMKLAATEDGSALSFGGESDPTHIQMLARGTNTSLKLVNHDGREQVIKPQ